MGGGRIADDDSSEEDGDEQWRAAINSVAGVFSKGDVSIQASLPSRLQHDSDDEEAERKPLQLKHYQIKAQKTLNDILENTLEIVRNPMNSEETVCSEGVSNEGGIQLFKSAPRGIVFDHAEKYEAPKRKPRIVPGEEVDDKSKKFRRRVQSVAVDGMDILAAGEAARRKSLARLEAREAAAKESAKKEEQRVADLKRIRGERWLPSIAKEMRLQTKTTPKTFIAKLSNS